MVKVSKIVFTLFLLPIFLSGCGLTVKNAALQVSSKPEASIFLDGKHLGKTPYFSDQLKSGVYTLKITAQEATYVDRITLIPGSLTVVDRELNDNILAQSGHVLWLEDGKNELFINSTPPEADVTISGKYYGKTPLLIPNIEAGDRKVLLVKESFKDHEFSVKVSENARLVANTVLAQADVETPVESENISTQKEVEILKTPQGFLRVRKEPDLTSIEVGRVIDGQKYEIIQETAEWIKISFDGKLGWISRQYTKNLE